ncbi:MAG: hypothetical protein ACK55X_01580 [Synechococcaceae cyanobacterium]
MDSDAYHQLRTLVPAPALPRAITIGSRPCAGAVLTLERLGLVGVEPSGPVDRRLLEARGSAPDEDTDDTGLLLCLRCRVSQAAEQKLQALVRQFGRSHQLDLIDLATHVLDDPGRPLPWSALAAAPRTGSSAGPFSLAVIAGFRPELAGLGHWTRLRVQSHPPLVRHLREHGLLLQRDWSLLGHASPTRMERAWQRHGAAAVAPEVVRALHGQFRERYRQARAGPQPRGSRWEPDPAFLAALEPAAEPALTLRRLQAMAAALRRHHLAALPTASPEALERLPAPAAAATAEPAPAWLERLEAALRRALAQQLPAMLAANGPEAALRACLWRQFANGLNQRAIGAACGCCQAKASRRLQLPAHPAAIATTALGYLAGQEGFAAVGRSLADTEAQAAALQTHLLARPPGADLCRLALWLAPLLPYPNPATNPDPASPAVPS